MLARVAELEQKLAEQEALSTRISQIEQRLADHEPKNAGANSSSNSSPQKSGLSTTRRKLLKGMGIAAAGLAASTTALASQASQHAQAASDDVLLLGNSNLASDKTYVSQTGSFMYRLK